MNRYEMAISDVVVRLAIIKIQAKQGKQAVITVDQIAQVAQLSPSTVQRSITRQRGNALRMSGCKGGRYTYEVLIEP